jgi:ACR3 family arsenite efflux pump ArsB
MLLELALWLGKDARFFNVFGYITLRTVLAAGTALVLSLVFGPPVIRWLAAKKIGQAVRDWRFLLTVLTVNFVVVPVVVFLLSRVVAGDQVLLGVAQALKKGVRKQDGLTARFGGDEFAILFNQIAAFSPSVAYDD